MIAIAGLSALPHRRQYGLLFLVLDQTGRLVWRRAEHDVIAEMPLAATVNALLGKLALDVANVLPDAVALILGDGRIVNVNLPTPLPVTSPPRSIMCSDTP